MKTVLIVPPHWFSMTIHLALPLLVGQLKAGGFQAEGLDLNVEFFNYILNKDYLSSSIDRINEFLYSYENGDINTDDLELKQKFEEIKEYKEKNLKYFDIVPEEIESSVAVFKDRKEFYKPQRLFKANIIIQKAFKIISYSNYPLKMSFKVCQLGRYNSTFDDLVKFSTDVEQNIFLEFFRSQINNNLLNPEIKYIGISITGYSQLFPGLTLARMIKEHTNTKVVIGGNYINKIRNELKKYPEFFDIFCDILQFGDGEKSVVEVAKYFNQELKIEEVSGIVYKTNEDKIIENPSNFVKGFDDVANISLEGCDFNQYLLPEPILPLQASRGCYWSKCSFCDITAEKKYCLKNLDKLIDEIKKNINIYGINKFEFIDESISPAYLELLADRLISEKFKIKYNICARLEKGFTKKLLKKAKKSGLILIMWGYESGSERILKLMNKGTYNNRLQILKDSANVGIWNHAFTIFDFPTETKEEASKTQSDINNNRNIINSFDYARFSLVSNKIISNPEKYSIEKLIKRKENQFKLNWEYECAKGMNEEQIKEIKESQISVNKKLRASFDRYFFLEVLFLYIAKYGVKRTKSFKIKLYNNWKENFFASIYIIKRFLK